MTERISRPAAGHRPIGSATLVSVLATSNHCRSTSSTTITVSGGGVASDQFRVAALWSEVTFTAWCADLADAEAIALPKHYSNATAGLTWLEGNMSWTRYNHVLTPGHKTCVNGVTWNGVAMTAGGRHGGVLGLLLGVGSVRPMKETGSPAVWRALGTIGGSESVPADGF